MSDARKIYGTMSDGEFYYAPLRRGIWGVWQHHELKDGSSYGSFVDSYVSREEARREVYLRNGWKYNN